MPKFSGKASGCADGIAAAFRGRGKLTEAEIKLITEELRLRAREGQAPLNMADPGWQKIALDVARTVNEAAAVERRNRRLNVAIKQDLLAIAEEADETYGDPSLGIVARQVGINSPLSQGNRVSADALGAGLFDHYVGKMVGELEKKELLPHLNKGYLDLEIARALEKRTDPEAKGSANKIANDIAEVIDKYRGAAVDHQNRVGSWVKRLKGYITRQSHDMVKVQKAGFEAWRDFVLREIDADRTFKGANPETYLREAYRTIVNGEQLSFKEPDSDLSLAFKGPGNLARKVSQHRVLHFKDADSWFRYNEQFGMGTLREAVMGEMGGLSRNIALMETFGPNPQAMLDDVLETLRRKHSDDPDKVNKLRSRILQAYMDEITGNSRVQRSIPWARRGRIARAWISMAKLGGAVLSSVTDFATHAAAIRYANGGGVLSPYAQALGNFFDGLPSAMRRPIADRVRAGTDGMIGSIAERFGATDTHGGTMSRAMRLFFKLNLLTGWTDAHKRGIAMWAARTLASYADNQFDQLPDHMKFVLGQYRIDAPRWEIIRQAVEVADDGRSYIFPDLFDDMPDEVFFRHGFSDPRAGRAEIAERVRSYFVDTTEFGIPTPGARERAIMTLGFKPGTVEGESLRFLMQFKSFPITMTTKVGGRLLWGNVGGKADKMGMVQFLVGTIILGYMAMSLKSIQRGQTPRELLDPTYGLKPATIIAAFVQGGGAGIYGDFLLGETNRFGRSMLDTLAGPGLGILADVDEIRAKLMYGDDATASALRLAMNNMPFVNLFYTRAALDYLILYQLQEWANPGYLRRLEKRIAKEQGQRYLLPKPSSVIPHGGGDRIGEGVR